MVVISKQSQTAVAQGAAHGEAKLQAGVAHEGAKLYVGATHRAAQHQSHQLLVEKAMFPSRGLCIWGTACETGELMNELAHEAAAQGLAQLMPIPGLQPQNFTRLET